MSAPAISDAALAERLLPPIVAVGCAALLLAIAGVIYLSSHIPGHPSLAPAIGLLAASAATVAGNVLVLSRLSDFAWWMFWKVWRWAMLAYAIIAGMLIYVFVYDRIPAGQLMLLVLTLAVFAVDIPLMLAFSVARYQPPRGAASRSLSASDPRESVESSGCSGHNGRLCGYGEGCCCVSLRLSCS
jgi:hypothetical protein